MPALKAPAPPREPIRRIAVLVCTRERMEALSRCLASIAQLEMPAGVELAVCVADNNPTQAEPAIRELGAAYGLALYYGYEPKRGYASVRNRAIALALEAGADLLIFIDDDSTVLPTLACEHIAALERHGADVVVGSFVGLEHRAREGQRMTKAGTGNVALRRWIVDPTTGAGTRFDPRLDLLGFEDHEFFRDATRAGGIMVRSARPLASDERSPGFGSPSAMSPQARRAFAIMEGRNEIVAARIRHGMGAAVLRFAFRMMPQLARAVAAVAASVALGLRDPGRGRAQRDMARLHLAKFQAALGGFRGPGYDRPLSKSGRLVELDHTERA